MKNKQFNGYHAAIYCRLSKDDDQEGESASIANQRSLLLDYCEKQGWEVVKIYQDDGYSGVTTDRPDFQRMLEAAKRGEFNLIVTKDLSRLGRNYLDIGLLTEDFFPRQGIRYIALNDNVDTLNGNNEIVPFKNILNEMYSQDISKKVHSAYMVKAREGKYTGPFAPFGYRKDPDDKNHLLVDEETAPIVRQIFQWASEGRGAYYICRRLEENQIPCPAWWNRQRGLRNIMTKWELTDPENGRFVWDFSVVKDMLRNPVYIGAISSQKTNYRFKLGTMSDKKPEEWIVVEGKHEPLVDRAIFNMVQEKIKSRQRPMADGKYNLFAGLVACGDCGTTLTLRTTSTKQPKQIFTCRTYNLQGKKHCTQHKITYDVLYDLVLNKIRDCAKAALRGDETAMADRLSDIHSSEQQSQRKTLERTVRKDEEELQTMNKTMLKLYEDSASGRLTEQVFASLLDTAQSKMNDLTARVKDGRKRLADLVQFEADNKRWIAAIREYADVVELDAAMLNQLVRKILVYETIDEDKTRHITVEIHFNMKPIPEIEQHIS